MDDKNPSRQRDQRTCSHISPLINLPVKGEGFLDDIPELNERQRRQQDQRQQDQRQQRTKNLPVGEPDIITPRVVYWRVIKCPTCNSKSCFVYSSKSPIRYHKCRDCGNTFKSIEEKTSGSFLPMNKSSDIT